MKVVAFNGSPRLGGNTELLLRKVLEPIAAAGIETELVQVGGRPVRGCQACYRCFQTKDCRCAHNGDEMNGWIAKILEADAVVIGSPTYFAGPTAEVTALLDRVGLVACANNAMLSRKIGAAVVAVRRGGAGGVQDAINHMFLMTRMIVPGSTYWNMGFGLEKGEAANDAEGLNNMEDLGETIAWLVKAVANADGGGPFTGRLCCSE
ncbi:MAG TPA: flavodoxin family protein [Candidatus Hydrogenedentes bacterium]|nr:flavodoxin family protein [Candidatus Hydrogenedentota bacterium]